LLQWTVGFQQQQQQQQQRRLLFALKAEVAAAAGGLAVSDYSMFETKTDCS